MADFETGAELELTVSQSSLSDARDTIESELGDLEVGVDAVVSGNRSGMQPRDPSSGQFMSIEGVEQRVVNTNESLDGLLQTETERWELDKLRNDYLEQIAETGIMPGGGGGGGGGGPGGFVGKIIGGVGSGAGKAAGGGIGTSALGVGAGVGIGALGIGAGAGLATGNIQLPEEQLNITVGNLSVAPEVNGPFVEGPVAEVGFEPTLNPVFNPQFNPEFRPNFEPVFNPKFSPEFSPDFDVSPTINAASPELSADVNFSPSLNISPTLNVTGVDLSGLTVDLRDEVVNSNQFQTAIEDAVDDAVSDIERRISQGLRGG